MPSTPEEAFVATGNPAFTIEEMQFAENSIVKIPWQGRCVLTADMKHGRFRKAQMGLFVFMRFLKKGHITLLALTQRAAKSLP